jgi:hypothetical protein
MKADFSEVMATGERQFSALIKAERFKCHSPPPYLAGKMGIYLLTEGESVLYVGRTNDLRKRLQNHVRRSHNTATFAFLLARRATGCKATYKPTGSRADLLRNNPAFATAFDQARERIRKMDVRVVEEVNPTHQALLEIYAAYVSGAQYNDFDNH